MNDNNISKLNIQFIYENQTQSISLFDAKLAQGSSIKKITVAGREYFYEENAKTPECINQLFKSLSEDKTFKTEKKLVSYLSKNTKIDRLSLTNDIYEREKDRLLGRTNIDSKALVRAKETLCKELIESKAENKTALLALINKSPPPLNSPKILFEIADQIENNGKPEQAHAIREAMRSFDLQPILQQAPELIQEHYIHPDQGKIIAEKLKKLFETGKYERFYDRSEFTSELTLDLRDLGNDFHLGIIDRKADKEEKIREEVSLITSKVNQGIGYFKITTFEIPNDKTENQPIALPEVKQVLDQMREANPNAIMIDLRNNGGGSIYVMADVASYFIEPNRELGQNLYRDEISKEELEFFPIDPVRTLSEQALPLEKRMLKQPLFILTSKDTGSAAEALAYHLKEHRQALIIGENTRGGAHVAKLFEMSPDFYIAISFGDYILKSGMPNWEAKGLSPDVEVEAEKAYERAEKEINQRI